MKAMITRRGLLKTAAAASSLGLLRAAENVGERNIPQEFTYADVQLAPGPALTQFQQTQSVLLSLNEDSLLKPWRLRAGLPAPGPDMGGWYDEVPLEKTASGGHGFAPAHCFGQWVSALARGYNATRDPSTLDKINRLLALYEPAISEKFYTNFRFPAYVYDKMVIGLIDAHRFAAIPDAYRLLELTTNAAEPHLPPRALDRDEPQREWRKSVGDNTSNDYCWDESYTMPENLYLAWERGAGERYRTLARRYLLDRTYFDPLSEGKNVLPNHHAYSFCNALSSAMQAYLADNSAKHLRAATNAFEMITATQSFATGGWGPNESFVDPNGDGLYTSLTDTHRGFETPCGSYAHFKLTRYLLRVSGDGMYGDSMERVFYNTVLGAKPLERDGAAFYYADYHAPAAKTYFPDKWPCCSGTLPQVAADYRISTYFHEPNGLLVNLYIPSTVKWVNHDGAQVTLTQTGDYPFDSKVALRIRVSRPSDFTLRLRTPAWAGPIAFSVNGEESPANVQRGFATIRRKWSDGDLVDVTIPLPMRLEPIDSRHPETVALMRGPLVLFAITDNPPAVSRKQLLAATPIPGRHAWTAETNSGPLTFCPYTSIFNEKYSTYVRV